MRAYFVLGLGLIVLALVAWYGSRITHPSPTPTSTPITTHPMPQPSNAFSLSSPAFKDGGAIPTKYTCDDQQLLSPPLVISNVPEGTKSLALIMDDPDVPKELIPEGVFVHWVLYNIPPETKQIPEGGTVGNPGGNGRDDLSYTGPCPPPEYEPSTHRYIFTLYALSGTLEFFKAPTASNVEEAVKGMTIAKTQLIGTYSRK